MTRPFLLRFAVPALGVALALVVSPSPSAQAPGGLAAGAVYVRDASGEMGGVAATWLKRLVTPR